MIIHIPLLTRSPLGVWESGFLTSGGISGWLTYRVILPASLLGFTLQAFPQEVRVLSSCRLSPIFSRSDAFGSRMGRELRRQPPAVHRRLRLHPTASVRRKYLITSPRNRVRYCCFNFVLQMMGAKLSELIVDILKRFRAATTIAPRHIVLYFSGISEGQFSLVSFCL